MSIVIDTNRGTDYTKIFRALVVDNEDPEGIGRVKVRIYPLHGLDNVSDANLPWASMCSPFGSANSGSFIVPEVGNTVFVAFEGGDSNYPIYLGSSYGKGKDSPYKVGNTSGRKRNVRARTKERPVESLNNDIKTVYKSPKGSTIIINDTDGEETVKIQDPLGQIMAMQAPMDDEYTQDNNHLNLGMCNINMTKKNYSDLSFLKRAAVLLLKGASSAFFKIVSKPDMTAYIEQRVEDTYQRLKSNGDFSIQTNGVGIRYENGVLRISAPDVNISAQNIEITANNVDINGNLKINGVSIFNVIGCDCGSHIDINQGGNQGKYSVIDEDLMESDRM